MRKSQIYEPPAVKDVSDRDDGSASGSLVDCAIRYGIRRESRKKPQVRCLDRPVPVLSEVRMAFSGASSGAGSRAAVVDSGPHAAIDIKLWGS